MRRTISKAGAAPTDQEGARDPILDAAYRVFVERGLDGATTLEIARRARTSKRTLYERFGSKEGIFAALVEMRASRMRAPLALGEPGSPRELDAILMGFGERFLEQLVKPTTLATYRLVLAHGGRGSVLAHTLDEAGRGTVIRAVTDFFAAAGRRGLVRAEDPSRPATTFLALLVGDLVFRLVLGVADTPSPADLRRRARVAADAVAWLYSRLPRSRSHRDR